MVLVWSHWCGAGIDNIAVPRWEFTRSPFMWREVMGDSTCNWSWLSLTYGSIFHYVELSKTCSRRAFTFTQKRQDVQSGKIIWSCTPEMLHYRVALKLFTLVALACYESLQISWALREEGSPLLWSITCPTNIWFRVQCRKLLCNAIFLSKHSR